MHNNTFQDLEDFVTDTKQVRNRDYKHNPKDPLEPQKIIQNLVQANNMPRENKYIKKTSDKMGVLMR